MNNYDNSVSDKDIITFSLHVGTLNEIINTLLRAGDYAYAVTLYQTSHNCTLQESYDTLKSNINWRTHKHN